MTRKLTRTGHVFGIASTFLAIASAQTTAVPNVSIDPATRTVTTANFQVTWNTGVDTEAITTLNWMGGSNVTDSYEVDTCGNLGPCLLYTSRCV